MITPIFIGSLVLAQIPMTVMVGFRRVQTDIRFFAGDDETLLRRMRAHGNFTETVPITLLAMAAAEYLQMPSVFLIIGGLLLVAGRLLHLFELLRTGWGPGRSIGMVMTFLAMIAFGGWCVGRSLALF